MIYIADGPSDVPVFSVVGGEGGKILAVHSGNYYEGVQQLQDDGRVNHTANADYTEDSDADRWLFRSLRKIADGICDRRERQIQSIVNPANHVT
jgi:hypothetical protein